MILTKQGRAGLAWVLAAWLVIGAGSPPGLAEPATGSIELDITRSQVTGPAWTSLLASAIVPGSGQWLEGRHETALCHGTAALVSLLMGLYGADQAARTTEPTTAGPHLRMAAAFALAGLAVWSPLELWRASHGSPRMDSGMDSREETPAARSAEGVPRPENGEGSVH